MNVNGQKVAVVGLGRSNLPLIRWLLAHGALVTACDRGTVEQLGERHQQLQAMGVRDFVLGPGYLGRLSEFGLIFLTPGMRKDYPEIADARARGAILTGEIPLVLRLCKAQTVGITGSAGKTTTTTLVGEILGAAGLDVLVGGNIGRPLIELVEELPETATVVLELSSFQLQLAERSPRVAVVTNVVPNHLDIHSSMAEYVDAKRNIYRYQNAGGRVVLNADNPGTAAMADEVGDRAVRFSRRGDPGGRAAAFVEAGQVFWRLGSDRLPVLLTREIAIPGDHNVENVLAAVAASLLAGAGLHAIRSVVPQFRGVEHRIETVRFVGGVHYINDSKATAPAETLAALRALPQPTVLIAGGYDKQIPFDEMAGELVTTGRVHTLILTGDTSDAIARAVAAAARQHGATGPVVHQVTDMVAAVTLARRKAHPGDIVLLSPACASFDRYQNFEERGRHFKLLVQELA